MAYVNELSGSKLRSKLGASLNEAAAAGPMMTGFAKKQLEKMGWKDGKGLGKNQQGMATHIKVIKREDDAGIGHVRAELQVYQQHQQQQWWSESMGNVFAKLNAGGSSGKKKKSKNGAAPLVVKQYTDEELFHATGGARFGMRAQRKQTGKWARAETISNEEEEHAKNKIEWNGQGQAKIILSETKAVPSKLDQNPDESETEEAPKTKKKEKKDKAKKKRKRDDETHETDDSKEKKRKKDRSEKKEKPEKKKMKTKKIVD